MNIVDYIHKYIENTSKGTDLGTAEVRSLSARIFKLIEDKNIDNILDLSEQLLKTGEWALWITAYDWAFRVRRQYTPNTYEIFERWLINYVTDWDDCDDFCTHAFGELISRHNKLFPRILKLTGHERFPVRRGAAVVLIYPIRSGRLGDISPFLVSDALMDDEHYLVLKGYGWMLKVFSQYKGEEVFQYLLDNHHLMPRVAFRYAMEKMDRENKEKLKAL
jgi:3-methyladenine DNA glycosylase AlkD